MKHKKLHITIILVLIWSFCFSQQFTNYTTKDGLPSNNIYTILQDVKGFIWFLTDKGMVKYNGNQFKTFTTKQGLPINDVWEGFTTPDAKVWYLSKSSKLGYIENDSVFSFPTSNEEEIMNPIFSSQIGNNVYPTGPTNTFELINGKWSKIFNNRLHNIDSLDKIKIFQNKIKQLSFNFSHDTITLLDSTNLVLKKQYIKPYYKRQAKRKQLNDSLYCWVTDTDYLILNLNNLKLSFSTFKDEIGLENAKHARINVINNQIQITGTGFVGFLDTDFHIKNPYFFPKEINSHFALIDKTNNIWLATFSNGVYKLPNVKKEIIYTLNNQNTGKFSIINNTIFTSIYNKGFYKYNDNSTILDQFLKIIDYPYQPTQIKELNTSFFPSKFTISTLKNNKLKTIDFRKTKFAINNLSFNFVYFQNQLYGIFSFGLNRINPVTLEIEKEYLQSGCNSLLKFQNKLLLATNNGLKEFKNDTICKVNFTNHNFDKSVLTITKISENELLLNTDGFGSYITDLKIITQLPNSEFLIVENAFATENTLWLATNEGVLKYTKQNNNYHLKQLINSSNGLPSNNINDVLIHENKIFASTNNGIAILPKKQESISQFLDIYIEKAFYNNHQIKGDNTVFKYEIDNNATFTISSINFDENPEKFNYQYKLYPVQKKWTTTSTNNFNFSNLQPKKYILQIEANGIKKQLKFTIQPLWWQTLLSKIAIAMLAIALIAFVAWWFSKKSLQKKNALLIQEKKLSEIQLRALRSQMNPHFVFNSLAAIQYYINNNQMGASEAYLVKFSKLIRQFFELSKEAEISLDEEIKLITNYLDLEKLRFKEKFVYKIIIDKAINKKTSKLPTMLLQPIVENAINHGIFNKLDTGNVSINFIYLDDKNFKIEVIDDGVGFVNTQKRSNAKVKSSHVLEDRLKYLNQSELWKIYYSEKELHPDLNDKGNISTFIITQL